MNFTKLTCFILFFIYFTSLSAQTVNVADTTRAGKYFQNGFELKNAYSYDSSAKSFETAARIFYENGIIDRYLQSIERQADIYNTYADKSQEAIELIENTLQSIEDRELSDDEKGALSMVYYQYGAANRFLGNYQNAIKFYEKALSYDCCITLKTKERIMTSTAVIHWFIGDYDKALEMQEEAIEILKSAENIDYYKLSIDYNVMGLIYKALGEYHESIAYYNAVLQYLELDSLDNFRLKGTTHYNLGISYRKIGDNDNSLNSYRKALRLFAKSNAPRNQQARVINSIGLVHLDTYEFDSSKIYLSKAKGIFNELYGSEHVEMARAFANLGFLYRVNNNMVEAKKNYHEAIRIRKKVNGQSANMADLYNDYSELLMQEGKLTEALQTLDSAYEVNTYSYKTILRARSEISLLSTISLKAAAYTQRYTKEKDLEHARLALSHFSTSDSLLNVIRNSYSIEVDQYELRKVYRKIYSDAMALCFQLYDQTGDDTYLIKAFNIGTKSKGFVLSQKLKGSNPIRFANIPDSLTKLETSLQRKLAQNRMLLSDELQSRGEIDSTLVLELQEKIFNNRSDINSLASQLKNNYPKYYNLRYKNGSEDINEIQENLSDNKLLLNFFQSEENVYLIKLSQENTQFVSVSLKELDSLIDGSNQAIVKGDLDNLLAYSAELRQALSLSPEEIKDFEFIEIIPDGIIWNLNFLALAEKKNNSIEYLGNSKMLTFNYIINKNEESVNNRNQKVVAFSFNEKDVNSIKEASYLSFRDFNEDIPGTSKEVAAISEIWDGAYYYGSAANETNFKADGDSYSIVHLAVHGIQDEDSPENSYFQFSGSDSLNDGRLHSYEIYGLDIDSDLAVLTACYSGEGKIVAGEGMMSMGRAFAYAGVNSIVASRWEVPDISAPYLMKYFYSGLKEGLTKSEALQYAQKEFLKNDADNITSAPFYWAGFYIIGDDSPINQSWPQRNLLFLIAAFFLMLFAFIVFRRKRNA